jgi:hypothetical protein
MTSYLIVKNIRRNTYLKLDLETFRSTCHFSTIERAEQSPELWFKHDKLDFSVKPEYETLEGTNLHSYLLDKKPELFL